MDLVIGGMNVCKFEIGKVGGCDRVYGEEEKNGIVWFGERSWGGFLDKNVVEEVGRKERRKVMVGIVGGWIDGDWEEWRVGGFGLRIGEEIRKEGYYGWYGRRGRGVLFVWDWEIIV